MQHGSRMLTCEVVKPSAAPKAATGIDGAPQTRDDGLDMPNIGPDLAGEQRIKNTHLLGEVVAGHMFWRMKAAT